MLAPTLFLAASTVSKPVAIGIAVAALVVLYLAFKVTKFVIKILLLLAALGAIGMAVRWYYVAH